MLTGDHERTAAHVCARGRAAGEGRRPRRGARRARRRAARRASSPRRPIFARVSPEQKAALVAAAQRNGDDVAFLGDGVNDAVALHDADVGISVDTAVDVAKEAADVLLLEKSLRAIADGVVEGRRIFANTTKYVLMGTSSNFGNMFSAAGASLFLSFLPMLPSQILLNNMLYDCSELTIPTDDVDEELLARPEHWDIGFIRRFMIFFGPISSLYDFLTFGVMIWVFHAHAPLFRSGWFVESLATQSLVVFVIRTRRVPFFRSRPSRPLLATTIAVVLVGAGAALLAARARARLPALPWLFLVILLAMIGDLPRARRGREGATSTATLRRFAERESASTRMGRGQPRTNLWLWLPSIAFQAARCRRQASAAMKTDSCTTSTSTAPKGARSSEARVSAWPR